MSRGTRLRRVARSLALACTVGASALVAGAAATGAAATAGSPPAYTWPEFHGVPALTGTSADPAISAADAPTLGVSWMSPVGAGEDSPVVAYDSALQETLAFVGAANGFFEAIDPASGDIVWSDYLGAAVTSTPLFENGNVWVAPQSTGRVDKIDAATGAVECSAAIEDSVLSTPVVATPPGGVTTVYFGSLGSGTKNGPVTAYAESDCQQLWQWSDYVIPGQNTGVWAPLSYGVDAAGVGLLVFGSANPDSEVYALDAATGALVWSYATYCPPSEDWDVGAGTDIAAPGVNGFADGMAYVEGKDGILYALDLTTGALVWSYNFGGNAPGNPTATNTDALSTPALSGTTLVFGDETGLYAVDAVTGAELWFTPGTGDVESSPIIVGPAGGQVVAYGDLAGDFHVADLANGAVLYSYKTGSYITGSPADVDGNLLVTSTDGFLYDFAPGGADDAPPATAVTAPAAGASLANPDGDVTISGTATDPLGVGAVTVQVQMDGASGSWFDQGTGSFGSGLATAEATLASPGATSTTWTLELPVPAQAASFELWASAVGVDGIADGTAYASATNADAVPFSVQASSTAPIVTVTPARVVPGGKVSLAASGFQAGESVAFTIPSSGGKTVTLATVTATSTGAASATAVALPVGAAFGSDPVSATGASSGEIGTGYVYVANNDAQYGYGPEHQGAESDDTVIHNYQGVGSDASKLVENWTVAEAGAVDTTPAIVDGVVYFGDAAGNLDAVSETDGQPVFSVPLGSAVASSPAVDGGRVFVGDDAGDLVALDATSGAVDWTVSLGGDVSSPAVAGGVVYVGSSDGEVGAYGETTGKARWKVSVGGDVSSAPAVDTAAKIVVATDTKGVVKALSTANGKAAWSVTVGGHLTGPMLSAADVYVASSSGALAAVTVATGAKAWSVKTAGAVAAPPILAYGDVTVGTTSGDVSYYDASTGALVNTQTQFGEPVTGLAFTDSVLLLTSSSGELGLIQGAKYLLMTWIFKASTDFASAGVMLNGDVFVAGEDGLLRAFTTPGRAVA